MQTSDNFDLKIYEGSDLFNPLTVENDNIETIDEQMYANQKAGAQVATELYSGGIHAITREVSDAAVFRFTAVSDYTAGETFTVDDTQVSAYLTSGEALPTGAFKIGSEVLCALKGARLTVYMSRAKAETAEVADGLKDGADVREVSYFATASALSTVSDAATGAGNLATQAKNKADQTAAALDGLIYVATFEYETRSVAAGKQYSSSPTNFSTAIPEGYTPIAIRSASTATEGVVIRSLHAATGAIGAYNATSTSKTYTPTATVLCVKSSFVGL